MRSSATKIEFIHDGTLPSSPDDASYQRISGKVTVRDMRDELPEEVN